MDENILTVDEVLDAIKAKLQMATGLELAAIWNNMADSDDGDWFVRYEGDGFFRIVE